MHKPFHWFIQHIYPQYKIDWILVEPLLQSRKLHKGEFAHAPDHEANAPQPRQYTHLPESVSMSSPQAVA
ncbi:MAG: hypothetical protein KME23_03645 [Goleter apudmare HA4340-LM2]|jgi:hypothetical protein|nr:hypothetical protein [Goleter apudmare HA4340-LM2]